MSKRFGLIGAMIGLVLFGVLLACGTQYDPSTDGLVIVGSQGSAVVETFAFTLSNGHAVGIANTPIDTANNFCLMNGLPSAMVTDATASYAFVIFMENSLCKGSKTGIATFNIYSDGNITLKGNLTPFKNAPGNVPVFPYAISRDSAGKFLFVADRATSGAPGSISVFSIGSGGTLTEVPGSPFFTPARQFTTDISGVAPTATTFPSIGVNGTVNAVCSAFGTVAPTTEFLYATDANNYGVWEFAVNTSTGALGNPPQASQPLFFAADQVPLGVAVDPCDRFVYVSNSVTNKISEYKICTQVVQNVCLRADWSLNPVAGSPLALTANASQPGALVVDPYGNNVYVVGEGSNTVSQLKISSVDGSLTPLNPAVVATGLSPKLITVRGDDNWLFVANYGAATVSQYSISPATGLLNSVAPILTDNQPWGVAVK
ncbi:MAG TPA: beta-propeller fold lactonase family protein [Candidatus Sulfotelmatobacter sp.]|nr:beta-propeller fold lactonase family protein [Candidatus Sulfotelmatobacter sp.]